MSEATATLGAPPQAASAPSSVPWFDWLFVILGGLPLALPLILWAGEDRLVDQQPVSLYLWVNSVVSAPHVYSTWVRIHRKQREKRIPWGLGLPLYLACAAVLAVAWAAGAFLPAMTFVNVVQSFHYLRQTYGVHRFYAFKGGLGAEARVPSYWAFHLCMPLLVLGRWDTIYTAWGGKPSDVIYPVQFPAAVMAVCWGLAGIGILAGLAVELRRLVARPCAQNLASAAIFLTYALVHGYGFLSLAHFQRGFFAVTIFHAVQYLGLVWVLEREKAPGRVGAFYRALPTVLGFGTFWGAVFMSGFAFERGLTAVSAHVGAVVTSVALGAISAHHYAVDAIIWRSRAGA